MYVFFFSSLDKWLECVLEIFVAMLALGAANGKSIEFNNSLAILCLGIRHPTKFDPFDSKGVIIFFSFFF